MELGFLSIAWGSWKGGKGPAKRKGKPWQVVLRGESAVRPQKKSKTGGEIVGLLLGAAPGDWIGKQDTSEGGLINGSKKTGSHERPGRTPLPWDAAREFGPTSLGGVVMAGLSQRRQPIIRGSPCDSQSLIGALI